MANYTLPINTGRIALFSNPGQGNAAAELSLLGVDHGAYPNSVRSGDGKTLFFFNGATVLVRKWDGSTYTAHSSFSPAYGLSVNLGNIGIDGFRATPDGLDVVFYNTDQDAVKIWRNTSGTTWVEVYSFAAVFPGRMQMAEDGLTVAYTEIPTVSGWDHEKVTILTKSGSVWSSSGSISTSLPTQNMHSYAADMALAMSGSLIAYAPDHTAAVRFYTRSGTTWSASTSVSVPDYPWSIRFCANSSRLLSFSSGVFQEITRGLTAWSVTTSNVASPSGQDWGMGFRSVGDFDKFAIETWGSASRIAVYQRTSGTLALQQELSPDAVGTPDSFSLLGLTADGKTLLAEAYGETTFDSSHRGHVYFFDYSGSSWAKTQKVSDAAQTTEYLTEGVRCAGLTISGALVCAGPGDWVIERGTTLTYAAAATSDTTMAVTTGAMTLTGYAAALSKGKHLTMPVKTGGIAMAGSWKTGQSSSKTDTVNASSAAVITVISGDGLTVMQADTDYYAPFVSIYDLSSGTPVQQTNFQVFNAAGVYINGMQLSDDGNVAVIQTQGTSGSTYGHYVVERVGGTWGTPAFFSFNNSYNLKPATLSLNTEGTLFAFTYANTLAPYGDGFAAMRKGSSGWVKETIAHLGTDGWATGDGHFGALSGDGQRFIGILEDSSGTSASILPYHYTASAWVADTPISIPGAVYALSSMGVDRSATKIAMQIYITGFVLKTRVYDISSGSAVQVGGDIPYTSVLAPASNLSLTDDGLQLGVANGNIYEFVGGAWVAKDDVASTDRVMFYGGMSRRGNVRVIGDQSTAHIPSGYDRKFFTRKKAPGFDISWNRSNVPYHQSLSLTTPNVGLYVGHRVPVAVGSIPFSGKPVTFLHPRVISPPTFALMLTAPAVTLSKTGQKVMGVSTATISLSGVAVALRNNQILTAAAGAIPLTGNPVILSQFKGIRGDTGALTLTGVAADLKFSRQIATGVIPITGMLAHLFVPHRHIDAATGALTITGYAAALSEGMSKAMAVTKGTLAVTGYAADMHRVDSVLRPATKAYALTGYGPALRRAATTMQVGPGAIPVTGYAAGARRNRAIAVATGAITLAGAPASSLRDRIMGCATGGYALNGYPVLMYAGELPSTPPAMNVFATRRYENVYVRR